MKLVYCFLLLLWPTVSSAQNALRIGEVMPDIQIPRVYNYRDAVIRLSQFQSKLTIIDFWTMSCGSCIESFPVMRALKKRFGDSLQLLFVDNLASDTKAKADRLFARVQMQSGQSFTFPYALQDTMLTRLFPHISVPHCVWLDSNLTVVAITYHDDVNRDNIQQYFSGVPLALPVKIDANGFDPSRPFLVNGNGGSPGDFMYRSIVSGYKDNLQMAHSIEQNADGKVTKVTVINYPLYALFQMAYHDILKYPSFRTFIEATDSGLFKRDKHLDKSKQHLFCFELITPPVTQGQATQYLQVDLARAFHAVATTEMRMMDCYIVTANQHLSQSITKEGAVSMNTDKESEHKYWRNVRLSQVLPFLEGLLGETIVDQTNFTGHIDIELPADLYEYKRQQLAMWFYRRGFTFTPVKKLMQVAVITDSK